MSKLFIVPLISIIISIPSAQKILTFSKEQPAEKQENCFKVISFNVKNLYSNDKRIKEAIEEFYNYLEHSDADIINLQEYNLLDVKRDVDKLKTLTRTSYVAYTDYFYSKHNASIITLSKYPIIGIESLRSENKSFAVVSNILFNDDTLKIVNVHLQSLYLNVAEINAVPASKIETKKIYGKFVYASKKREKQTKEIRAYIGKYPHKTLICGDFNDPPCSYTYHHLVKNMKDSFMEKGNGLGFTFKDLPLLRIDYIIVSKDINVNTFNINKYSNISDHSIIITELSL